MVAPLSEARWLRSNLPLRMPRSCGFCPGIHWYTGLGLLLKYHLTTRPENLSPAISVGFSVYSQSSNAERLPFLTEGGTRKSFICTPATQYVLLCLCTEKISIIFDTKVRTHLQDMPTQTRRDKGENNSNLQRMDNKQICKYN